MCVVSPMRWGTDFGEVPGGRSADSLRASQGTPWRWNGSILAAREGGATTKVAVNGVVINATHAACQMPAVSAEGPGTMTFSAAPGAVWNVSYYNQFGVAVGLRPYISETHGSLLLRTDPASPYAGSKLTVSASLPFGGHHWSWTTDGDEETVVLTKLRNTLSYSPPVVG